MHGDIKPANIIHDDVKSTYKLIDFGSSRLLDENTKSCNLDSITPAYAAPELLLSYDPVNEQCDVWSFGKIAEELLHITEFNPNKRSLENMVLKALHDDPKKRPSSRALTIIFSGN
jgi:serine/threonine protein kinase